MFQPEGSKTLVNDGLSLFEPTRVNSGVNSVEFVEYLPRGQLSDDAPVEIVIPNTSPMYVDLKQTFLHIKAKVVKSNGADLEASDVVTPTNLFMHSMWRQVDVYLNQKLVSSGGTNYSYKAMVDVLLSKRSYHETILQSQLFYKDTAGTLDRTILTDTPLNVGLIKRNLLARLSKTIDMEGSILSDIFLIDKYLLNGVELRLKLWPNKDDFRLMASDKSKKYKVKIIECFLKVCYVNVTPGVIVAHAELLKQRNAQYQFARSEIKIFALASGQYNINVDDAFQGIIPSKVVIGMVTSAAYSGQYDKSPFNFGHFNLDFIGLYVNNESRPFKPMKLKFSTEGGQNYIGAYQTLFSGCGWERENNIISRSDYPQGYTLFVFDLDQHTDAINSFPAIRKGNLRIEGHFASPLSETVNIIIYAKFPSILEIDSARNVFV